MSEKLAITRRKKDLLRIIPIKSERKDFIDLKFSLLENEYKVKFSDIDKQEEIFFSDEITYHSKTEEKSAKIAIVDKSKKKSHETKIDKIKDLNLFTEFPIPVCKLQISDNLQPKKYKYKEYHSHLDVAEIDKNFPKKVNAIEVYVAPENFDWNNFMKKWFSFDLLSKISSINYLKEGFRVNKDIYNLIFNSSEKEILFAETRKVKNIQIKTKFYFEPNITENTLIFYNNRNFINYLATTPVSFKRPGGYTDPKPAFELDLKRQKKKDLSLNKQICDWKNSFENFAKENNLTFPEGIIIPRY